MSFKTPSWRRRLRQWPLPCPGMALEIKSLTNGATAATWCASQSGVKFHAIVTLFEDNDSYGGFATSAAVTSQELFGGLIAQGFDPQFIELHKITEYSVADLEARRIELVHAAARGFDA